MSFVPNITRIDVETVQPANSVQPRRFEFFGPDVLNGVYTRLLQPWGEGRNPLHTLGEIARTWTRRWTATACNPYAHSVRATRTLNS